MGLEGHRNSQSLFYRELKDSEIWGGEGDTDTQLVFQRSRMGGGWAAVVTVSLMIPAQGMHESFQDLTRDLARMNSWFWFFFKEDSSKCFRFNNPGPPPPPTATRPNVYESRCCPG